jgi:F-type H+-transporting ATPase subunit b
MTSRRMDVKTVFALLAMAFLLTVPTSQMHALAQEAPASAAASQSGSEPRSGEAEKREAEKDESDAYRHSATVKAIGAKLGMNPEQAATAFTVTNLLILLALVGWFLLKTLPKTFRGRNDAIQKHVVEARVATEEANARLSKVESRLSKLDEEIATLKAQAEKDAAQESQRIKASVEEEKKHILASAEQEISAATANARRLIQQYAADLAIDQAAKKLVISAETDRLLVQDFARRLTGDVGKEGQN